MMGNYQMSESHPKDLATSLKYLSFACFVCHANEPAWIPFGDHPLKLERCKED